MKGLYYNTQIITTYINAMSIIECITVCNFHKNFLLNHLWMELVPLCLDVVISQMYVQVNIQEKNSKNNCEKNMKTNKPVNIWKMF